MKTLPWQLDPASYDFRHCLSPHYSHLDTVRHVNNVAVHSFHTEARMCHQLSVLGHDTLFSDDVLLRPRRTVTNFLGETHYPHEVVCGVKLVAVHRDHYRLAIGLFQSDTCVSVQECLIGAWHENGWIDLPAHIHKALIARIGEHVTANDDWPDMGHDLQDLCDYPREIGLSARYGDMDPDGCLGELALARYVEQSRSGLMSNFRGPGRGFMVARVDIRYERWDHGIRAVRLGAGLARTGNSSFAARCGILLDAVQRATAESVMVLIDRVSRRPVPISQEMRHAMAPLAMKGDSASAPEAGSSAG